MDDVVSTLKMVVIVLISWESPEGMSPGHANEKLQKKIEILGELISSSILYESRDKSYHGL